MWKLVAVDDSEIAEDDRVIRLEADGTLYLGRRNLMDKSKHVSRKQAEITSSQDTVSITLLGINPGTLTRNGVSEVLAPQSPLALQAERRRPRIKQSRTNPEAESFQSSDKIQGSESFSMNLPLSTNNLSRPNQATPSLHEHSSFKANPSLSILSNIDTKSARNEIDKSNSVPSAFHISESASVETSLAPPPPSLVRLPSQSLQDNISRPLPADSLLRGNVSRTSPSLDLQNHINNPQAEPGQIIRSNNATRRRHARADDMLTPALHPHPPSAGDPMEIDDVRVLNATVALPLLGSFERGFAEADCIEALVASLTNALPLLNATELKVVVVAHRVSAPAVVSALSKSTLASSHNISVQPFETEADAAYLLKNYHIESSIRVIEASWRLRPIGGISRHLLALLTTPEQAIMRQQHSLGTVAQAYVSSVPPATRLVDEERVQKIIQVVTPNLNPAKTGCLESRETALSLLRESYASVFEAIVQK